MGRSSPPSVIFAETDSDVEKMEEVVRYVKDCDCNVHCCSLFTSETLLSCSVAFTVPLGSGYIIILPILCLSVTRSIQMFLKRPSLVFRYRQCRSLLQLRYENTQ